MAAMLQKFRLIDYEFPVQYLRIDVATQTEQQVMGLDNLVWTAGHGNADFLVKNNLAIHIITNNINSRQFNWTKGFKTAAGMWHKIRLQFVSSQNEKVASLIHSIDEFMVDMRRVDESLDRLKSMFLDICECNGHAMSEHAFCMKVLQKLPDSPEWQSHKAVVLTSEPTGLTADRVLPLVKLFAARRRPSTVKRVERCHFTPDGRGHRKARHRGKRGQKKSRGKCFICGSTLHYAASCNKRGNRSDGSVNPRKGRSRSDRPRQKQNRKKK